MEMSYFIIFGSILAVVLTLTFIIFRLNNQLSDLKYELKLGKINCQKDLDRLEERINQFFNQSNSDFKHSNDIEKLDKLIKNLNKLVDGKIDDVESAKKLLKD
jgi:predicted Holliday junction resolvase-like endonuclease